MGQAKILPMTGMDAVSRKVPRWKKLLVILGFMKHPDEPQVNGTALFFAIAFGLAVIYIFLGGAVNFALMVDDKRAVNMTDKMAAQRNATKLTKDQEKRAELLDFIKTKGLYDEVPDRLKIFEQPEKVSE